MSSQPSSPNADKPGAMEIVLGYLNFSSGSSDPKFYAAMNELFAQASVNSPSSGEAQEPRWQSVRGMLEEGIASITSSQSALGDCQQAKVVVRLVFETVLPAYRQFHGELLFHQSDDIYNGFFISKVCEAVLAQGPPWDESERISANAINAMSDYVGYRPVPTLQTHKHEPYDQERICPIPLYIDGAGIAVGRYHDVVEIAMSIIRRTDEGLLRSAFLNPDWLSELALDPRAYDFDHPANKRPNHHFGQWDPHCIDNSGRYRRLVVQQVTLDALMDRVENPSGISQEEALWEGGAVLAGVMLMATGICGWGPEAINSTVSLGNLLPHIAAYRDAFYEQLLNQTPGEHGLRLRDEAQQKRQPFAGARQQLNASLTRRRAAQIGHVQLARLFARMGFSTAAQRHADIVPSAAARISCRIDCTLDDAKEHIEQLQLEEAAADLAQAEHWLKQGIRCGAIIDPWTILGFDANYSLFPAMENSIRDIRADELATVMDQLLQSYTSLWCAAAATNDEALTPRIANQMRDVVDWWHQFAAHEVSNLDAPNGELAYEAAKHVAEILQQWHAAGAAGGDIRFWAPHAHLFETPKAYSTVIEALLDRGDYVASKGLLVHWLSRAEETGLEQGESRFASLALRWLTQLQQDEQFTDDASGRWELTRHLFDMFEVNAEQYGQAPQFLMGRLSNGNGRHEDPLDVEETDDEDSIYGAAYEEVVYRDTTDDGFEGDIFDYGQPSEGELEAEAKRVGLQLGYLTTLAQLWKVAAWGIGNVSSDEQRGSLLSWFQQADAILKGLRTLASDVANHRVASAGLDCEAHVEFDRQRTLQEALLERIALANVEVADAALFVLAAASAAEETIGNEWDWPVVISDEGRLAVSLTAALQRGDRCEATARFAEYLEAIEGLPLLYIPISRGGDPHEFVLVRRRQKTLQNLAYLLPRSGLLRETRRIVETARRMERDHPVGPGAVTEFDGLFEVAYRAIVDCVLQSSRTWFREADEIDETAIFALLEHITRPLNEIWDGHSRTLRLSVLERAADEKTWTQLVRFIRTYGGDLFTQQFLNLGNIRAIQHRGVEQWLDEMVEHGTALPKMFDDLGGRLSRRRAVRCLSLILDAVAENYFEYRDYNATRTESDRGEELYKLLDFLRLRVEYDTVAWRYRPIIIAHELVLQRGRPALAELFRRGLEKCTREKADHFQQRLEQLQDEHAMLMPTVAEKIAERFVQPTAVHRACSLIEPAMREGQSSQRSSCFELLEQEAETLVEEFGGVGLDIPQWLLDLEDEVDRIRRPLFERDEQELLAKVLPQLPLTQEQLEELLADWSD